MKTLLKYLMGVGFVGLMAGSVHAQTAIDSTIEASNTGTTSATVVIPSGNGFANITDVSWKLDTSVTTGTIGIRMGEQRFNVTSATAASQSVIWFANANTGVAIGEYVIYFNSAAGTYTLLRAKSATTTSITVQETIAPAETTSDYVWSTLATVERAVPNANSVTVGPNLWLPKNVPTALTIDGNTTACRISVSGVRGLYK